MKANIIIVLATILMSASQVGASPREHVGLAFSGFGDRSAGCYDDYQQDSCAIALEPLRGPEFEGSLYYLTVACRDLESLGCQAYDSESCCGCAFPELTIYFDPDSVLVGTLSYSVPEALIKGTSWREHQPKEFTSLRVEFRNGHPCTTTETFLIPLRWVDDPDPVQRTTWGAIRKGYRQ